ncbi:hypothetical protein H4219_005023 [Mycoemilia scoparia]|uniref:Uncharacterized protein n=1 Tax=Mycoemilia scoparia TaxID=417184 RepID=A0A9W7ZZ60_9FUNG|nr:hypothetical protein H4219_005023 [Mycoemilia scoparia]
MVEQGIQPISAAFVTPIPPDAPFALEKEVAALSAEVSVLRDNTGENIQHYTRGNLRVAAASSSGFQSSSGHEEKEDEGNEHNNHQHSPATNSSNNDGSGEADIHQGQRGDAQAESHRGGYETESSTVSSPSAQNSQSHQSQQQQQSSRNSNPQFSYYNTTIGGGDYIPTSHNSRLQGGPSPINSTAPTELSHPTPLPTTFSKTSRLWNDPAKDEDWPVMQSLSQDAISNIVGEVFEEVHLENPNHLAYKVFFEYLCPNINLISWFEVSGSVF